jgi:hypothetical protein
MIKKYCDACDSEQVVLYTHKFIWVSTIAPHRWRELDLCSSCSQKGEKAFFLAIDYK